MKKLLIVTGELSGFNYAKELIPRILKDFAVYGVFLEEIPGTTRIFDSKKIISFGLFESLKNLPALLRAKNRIEKFLKENRPDAVLLIDFPGFNLKIAEMAKNLNIKVLYFISPKFWAWGEGRLKKISKVVDRMFVIFPFEEQLYRRAGVDVTYVGNPLIDMVKPSRKKEEFLQKFGLNEHLIALLPGSRQSEVNYLLKPLLETSKRFEFSFAIPVASSVKKHYVEDLVRRLNPNVKLIPENERYNLLYYSKAGIIASGTASLEAAIAGLPHVVVYKMNRLTFTIAKKVVKLTHISLPNIIAGKEVVPELLQERANPDDISSTLTELIENEKHIRELLKKEVTSKLSGRAIEKLAEEVAKSV